MNLQVGSTDGIKGMNPCMLMISRAVTNVSRACALTLFACTCF